MFKTAGILMFILSAGDVGTTYYGLRQPGIEEANPLMRSPAVAVMAHVAVPAMLYWSTEELHKRHSKLAWGVRIGFCIGYSYVIMHNLHVIHSQGAP